MQKPKWEKYQNFIFKDRLSNSHVLNQIRSKSKFLKISNIDLIFI